MYRENSRLVFGDDDDKLKALVTKIGQDNLLIKFFNFMKNFDFMALFIAIVAPIVKKFPNWAVKYTKNTHPYAEEFQLSAEEEEKYLLTHPHSAEWIGLRRWHLQTRKYFFKNKHAHPEIFEAFMRYINNNTVYDAAYEFAPEDAVKAKSYTLDTDRVIKACNDNINCLYILADKQPQTFSVSAVRELSDDVKEAYFSYLFTKCRWEKLMELDVVLFEESAKNKVAEKCLSFLMGLKDYTPRLSPEQLATLGDKFEKWCEVNPFLVANKMAEFWESIQDFKAIDKLLRRAAKCKASQRRNDICRYLLLMIPEDQPYYADDLILLLNAGIACPFAFGHLFTQKDAANIDFNLSLCISQKLEGKIPERFFDRLSLKQQENLLVALAKDGILSQKMLSKAPNDTIKKELLNILEEQAQVKWFVPLMHYSIKDSDLEILAHAYEKGKICPALQNLTFKDNGWVWTFVKNGWYDEEHIAMLLKSNFVHYIQYFIQNHGITQAQYEVLMSGPNANLVPMAMRYLKKE